MLGADTVRDAIRGGAKVVTDILERSSDLNGVFASSGCNLAATSVGRLPLLRRPTGS